MAKMSQPEAEYVAASQVENARCSLCTMFRAPNRCTAVDGAIAPGGWCKLFERRRLTSTKERLRRRGY